MKKVSRPSIRVPQEVRASCSTTVRQRQEWIERYRRSGQSQRAFAQAHGLKLSQFRYWLYDRTPKAQSLAVVPRLQEVSLSRWPGHSGWSAEIALPTGSTVRLNERLARELIGPLLQTCPQSHV